MAYQPSWFIQCQSHTCRTVAVLFDLYPGKEQVHTFPKSISPADLDAATISATYQPNTQIQQTYLSASQGEMRTRNGGWEDCIALIFQAVEDILT